MTEISATDATPADVEGHSLATDAYAPNASAADENVVLDHLRATAPTDPHVFQGIAFRGFSGKSPLPYVGAVHVAVIPDGATVGSEAVVRLIEILSRGQRTQERLTSDLHDALKRCLAPGGVFVMVVARHGESTGGPVVTTRAVSGAFSNAAARTTVSRLLLRRRPR